MKKTLNESGLRVYLVPALVFLASAAILGTALFFGDAALVREEKLRARNEALLFASAAERSVLQATSPVHALAALVRSGRGAEEQFQNVAAQLLSSYPEAAALFLLPDGAPPEAWFSRTDDSLGETWLDSLTEAVRGIERTGRRTFLAPFRTPEDSPKLVALLSVSSGRGSDFSGFVGCLIRLDLVLEQAGVGSLEAMDFRHALWREEKGAAPFVLHSSEDEAERIEKIVREGVDTEILILNERWTLSVFSEHGWRNRPLILLLSAGEILLSLLLALVVRLFMRTRAGESKYRLLAENAKDVIWTMSLPDLEFTYISPSVSELTGFSVEEAKRLSLEEALEPESARSVMEVHAERLRLFREGVYPERGYFTEVRQRCKDGSLIWVGIRSSYIVNETGEPVGVLGVSRDISEIKRTQEALERANATKNTFLALIAHDLRGSIGAIRQALDMLQTDYKSMDEEELEEFLSLAGEDAQKTFRLLENLLTWSRSQLDQIDFRPVDYGLRDLAEEGAALLRSRAAEKRVSLAVDIPEDLTARLDPGMIGTVLRNLLGNALKFTSSGGRVEVSARRTPDGFEVAVRDTGRGVPPEIAEKLFRIDAKRVSTPGTAGERGSGLGLILCKEFVEKHGGRIWFENAPEGGAVFRFTLPAEENVRSLL